MVLKVNIRQAGRYIRTKIGEEAAEEIVLEM